jgi:hypothetical protein
MFIPYPNEKINYLVRMDYKHNKYTVEEIHEEIFKRRYFPNAEKY